MNGTDVVNIDFYGDIDKESVWNHKTNKLRFKGLKICCSILQVFYSHHIY